MALIIEDKDLQLAGISEQELLIEIAVLLYQKGKLSLGKASEMAKMQKVYFQKELAKREVDANYDEQELEKDLRFLGL